MVAVKSPSGSSSSIEAEQSSVGPLGPPPYDFENDSACGGLPSEGVNVPSKLSERSTYLSSPAQPMRPLAATINNVSPPAIELQLLELTLQSWWRGHPSAPRSEPVPLQPRRLRRVLASWSAPLHWWHGPPPCASLG